jgi:ATP-binding cassette subfamily A (ABC1) protein 3
MIKNLRKIYLTREEPLVAVDRISIGVKTGEIFTLLGVNGAGFFFRSII